MRKNLIVGILATMAVLSGAWAFMQYQYSRKAHMEALTAKVIAMEKGKLAEQAQQFRTTADSLSQALKECKGLAGN